MTINRILWYILGLGIILNACNRLDEDQLNSTDQIIEINAAVRPENSALFNFANTSQLDKNSISLQVSEYPTDGTIRILDDGKILFYGDATDNGKNLNFSGTVSDPEQTRKFEVRLSVSDTVRNDRTQECPNLLSFTYKANQGEIFKINFQPVLDTLPACIFREYNFDNISVIGLPENGAFSISNQPINELIFIPNEGFVGTDMVTLKVPSNKEQEDLHMVFAFQVYACFADVEDDFFTVELGANNALLNVLENDSICNLPINSMAIVSGPSRKR